MLNRRLSPRAATVVTAAAVLAAVVAVTPSFAGTYLKKDKAKAGTLYLTQKRASKTFVSNQKASETYLKKKAAGNLYLAKATAPIPAGRRRRRKFGAVQRPDQNRGLHPIGIRLLRNQGESLERRDQFLGTGHMRRRKSGPGLPDRNSDRRPENGQTELCPDDGEWGQRTETDRRAITSWKRSSTNRSHDLVQVAGADKVSFKLFNWNLTAEAYPQPEETAEGDDRDQIGSRSFEGSVPSKLKPGPA